MELRFWGWALGSERNACVVRGMLDLLCKSKTGGNLGDEEEAEEEYKECKEEE